MKTCGIISEYNPFHNGHEYHIKKTREESGADGIITVMSGSFTQRGGIALFDKWTRAKNAVSGGANLVIELPFCFACGSAEYFAAGGVRLLQSVGCVDMLSFGSESGSLSAVSSAASAENEDFKNKLKEHLGKGMSFPKARSLALDIPEQFFSPNNILGAEYIKAINKYATEIKPLTIKRIGEGYNSDNTDQIYISATGCRKLFYDNDFERFERFVPANVLNISLDYSKKKSYTKLCNLSGFAAGLIRRSPDLLKDTAYVGEGLENRFIEAANKFYEIDDIIDFVKTKRYTRTRLARILICAMVGLTAEKLELFSSAGPGYIRVLAADDKGYEILRKMKNTASVPVITKVGGYKNLSPVYKEMFEMDCRATDIFSLAYENPSLRKGRMDFSGLERI